MQYFLTTHEEGSYERPVFIVEIQADANKPELNPLMLIILGERADGDARRLSAMHPNGIILLKTMARVKAVYKNGERTNVHSFKNFYNNLTEEQYKATQILCSKTHQYV